MRIAKNRENQVRFLINIRKKKKGIQTLAQVQIKYIVAVLRDEYVKIPPTLFKIRFW
jgi:hypothetical protein